MSKETVESAEQAYARTLKGKSAKRARTDGWEYLLTAKMKTYKRLYERLWREKYGEEPSTNPNCIFDLSWNPAERPGRMSTKDGVIPTLTRNSSRFWSPYLRRWLLPPELAAASGWEAAVAF